MAHTLITPTALTNEALRILHQKLRFVGTIDRQYDNRFATSGAKIGTSLQIREPNQFTVRSGRTLDLQDITETYQTLNVTTQKGVDFAFDSSDLTMTIDNFSERYLEPAMARLAASIEADVLGNVYKDVWNEVSDVGAAIEFVDVLRARQKMVDDLTPDGDWNVQLNTLDNISLVDALKGLFHNGSEISKQYKEGMVGQTAGFKFFENTHAPIHTTGTDTGLGVYLTDTPGTTQTGSSIHIDTGATTFKKGDVICFEDLIRVHPETKVSTGVMHRFVVTSDYAGGEGDLAISPAIVASGAKQNVTAALADGKKVYKIESDLSTAIGASADYTVSLAYHKEAFTFVTADLVMPQGVDFSARKVYDGISMRVVRQYDINNDLFPCRIDIFYGYKTIRPQFACRLGFN